MNHIKLAPDLLSLSGSINFDSFVESIESPEQLSSWMIENIKYSWMDCDNNFRKTLKKNGKFRDKYTILSPQQVYTSNLGSCVDQALFEDYVFKNSPYLADYITKHVFLQVTYTVPHAFLVFIEPKNSKLMYFENAFDNLAGIHGPFDSIESICDFCYKNIIKCKKAEALGYEYAVLNPNDIKPQMSWKQYHSLTGLDEEKTWRYL